MKSPALIRLSGGYTLVELIVVIGILSVLGGVFLNNFKNFSQQQLLNKNISNLQSRIVAVQGAALANQKCDSSTSSLYWYSSIVSSGGNFWLQTYCYGIAGGVVSTVMTDSFKLDSGLNINVCKDSSSCSSPAPACVLALNSSSSVQLNFKSLTGEISFSSPSAACLSTGSSLTIELVNSVNNSKREIYIKKGGVISVN